eukprot:SAG31_NODE_8407_length_1457_cov_1.983800_1_plen_81_part_10
MASMAGVRAECSAAVRYVPCLMLPMPDRRGPPPPPAGAAARGGGVMPIYSLLYMCTQLYSSAIKERVHSSPRNSHSSPRVF